MLTVYILASRQEARYVEELWTHTALLRRHVQNIAWASPLYVEDMATSNNVGVLAMSREYIVIGCMSNSFVSAILDQPALREMVEGALKQVPFIVSPCHWNQEPCPFVGKMPLTSGAITSTQQRDSMFVEAARRIREMLTSFV